MPVMSHPAPNAEHLTRSLQAAGVLRAGRVRSVSVLSEAVKQRSHTTRLRLDYDGAEDGAPRSLIIKAGRLDGEGRAAYANKREVAFYRDVAPGLPRALVPRCFEALDATDATVWQLTLEDLTDTHVQASQHPLPPVLHLCEAIVRRWAAFHAACWGKQLFVPSTGNGVQASRATSQARAAEHYAIFVDRFPDLLSPGRRWLFDRLLDRMPNLLLGAKVTPLTLIHGDAHWWNCLVPRPGQDKGVRLLDWEDWGIGISAMDLAYMIAMMWFPDLRHRIERPLIQQYHAELMTRGVSGYDLAALEHDYRSAVLLLMWRPVSQAVSAIPPRVWWPNLERIMLAVDDLGCEELLD